MREKYKENKKSKKEITGKRTGELVLDVIHKNCCIINKVNTIRIFASLFISVIGLKFSFLLISLTALEISMILNS